LHNFEYLFIYATYIACAEKPEEYSIYSFYSIV